MFGAHHILASTRGCGYVLMTDKLMGALLARFRDEVDATGGELVVMLLPAAFGPRPELIVGADFEQRYETPKGAFTLRMDEPRTRLAGITERLGISFIDPTPDFIEHVRAADIASEYYFGNNNHFGDDAHRWIAERLYADLLSRPSRPRVRDCQAPAPRSSGRPWSKSKASDRARPRPAAHPPLARTRVEVEPDRAAEPSLFLACIRRSVPLLARRSVQVRVISCAPDRSSNLRVGGFGRAPLD